MSSDKMKEAWESYWESRIDEIYYYDAKNSFEAGWQACAEAMQQDRAAMQSDGKHPAPCARVCEAKAFEIEIRSLKAQLKRQQDQTVPEFEGMDQDWKGMSGAIAFHLIDRHADGWDQIGAMMNAWLEANKAQQDATTLRQAITNIHDRILRGDSDWELMAMCDSALKGTS